jgi:hypothetical protein
VKRLLWAWLATFFAFAAVAHGNFETTDAGFTLLAAKNLAQRGDSGILHAVQGATSPTEQKAAEAIQAGICGKVGTNGVAYTWFPVGHVWLLVPFAAAGDVLGQTWPAVEARFGERGVLESLQGRPVFTQGLVSLLLPPACAASLLVLLFLLARTLGAGERDAWLGSLAIVFATQCFAFGRETLSDGPGLVFLLASVLATARVHTGSGTTRTALLGGLAAGASVLLRYQNAALQLAIGTALLLACWRQRRWPVFGAFVLGVLPAMALLFAVDYARFGNIFDTGYPKVDDWLDQPPWLGVAKILFGAGRGVAWLSPLVWLALPLALHKAHVPQWRWLAWIVFLFPLCFFAFAQGWQGGQCWAARYVTHGLVLLLAITLPQARPWQRWPRTWWALVAAGVFVSVTSITAPTRGVQQLANQAAWARGLAEPGDAADPISWRPEYTPLVANWRYAFASARGEFEIAGAPPKDGSAIATVFGATATTERQREAPVRWEDRAWRHLWWRFWGDLLGIASWLLLLPTIALAGLCTWRAFRPQHPAPSESSTAR